MSSSLSPQATATDVPFRCQLGECTTQIEHWRTFRNHTQGHIKKLHPPWKCKWRGWYGVVDTHGARGCMTATVATAHTAATNSGMMPACSKEAHVVVHSKPDMVTHLAAHVRQYLKVRSRRTDPVGGRRSLTAHAYSKVA